jgi:hypothetical protein
VLKLLLLFSREKEIHHIKIFGDSMDAINWARKLQICHNIFLMPILEDIFHLKDIFDSLVISHVYRDKNMVADTLSKAGLQLTLGQWQLEYKGEDTYAFYHRPFIENHEKHRTGASFITLILDRHITERGGESVIA